MLLSLSGESVGVATTVTALRTSVFLAIRMSVSTSPTAARARKVTMKLGLLQATTTTRSCGCIPSYHLLSDGIGYVELEQR
jgi:hypothetical protein